MTARWGAVAGVGLAVSAGAAWAQPPQDMTRLANLPVSAMQNGMITASTRTDGRGGFRLDLPGGVYDLCVEVPRATAPRATGPTPRMGPPNDSAHVGARAPALREPELLVIVALTQSSGTSSGGGSAASRHQLPLGGAPISVGANQVRSGGASAQGCIPYTVMAPGDGADGGSTRYYVGGFADLAVSEALTTGAGSTPEGREVRRADPRIPPPGGLRVAADVSTLRVTPQLVTVTGALSLER